jgi:hypothetical protein
VKYNRGERRPAGAYDEVEEGLERSLSSHNAEDEELPGQARENDDERRRKDNPQKKRDLGQYNEVGVATVVEGNRREQDRGRDDDERDEGDRWAGDPADRPEVIDLRGVEEGRSAEGEEE